MKISVKRIHWIYLLFLCLFVSLLYHFKPRATNFTLEKHEEIKQSKVFHVNSTTPAEIQSQRQFTEKELRNSTIISGDNRNNSSKLPTSKPPHVDESPEDSECKQLCFCNLQVDEVKNSLFCSGHEPAAIPHYPNHVCPQNFRNLADYVYGWNGPHHGEKSVHIPSMASIRKCLKPGSIIYVVGWHLDAFFNDEYPHLKHPFVLITGESDLSVPSENHLRYLTSNGSKIIHWFGQNGIINNSSIRFTQIPIGLNCYEQSRYIDSALLEIKKLPPPPLEDPSKRLMLLNFDQTTDGSGGREVLWNLACKENGTLVSFSSCFGKERGVQQYLDKMTSIYKRNAEFPFWASPKGNGLDCHRTWEAFYFNRIPISLHSELDSLYEGLPIILLDDWKSLNRTWLQNIHAQYTEETAKKKELLSVRYWSDMILSKSQHKSLFNRSRNRCWGPKV